MQFNGDSKLFQTLFDHASIGIIVVNSSAEIITINKFARQQFGYSEVDDVVSKKIELFIPSRFHHRHEQHRDAYMHDPKSRSMGIGLDLFAVKKDGSEFPVEISLGNYHVDENKYVVAFVSVITLRKQAEQALVKLNEELEKKVEDRTVTLRETVEKLNEQILETEEKDRELMTALSKEKELGELKSRFVSVASHEFRTPLSTVLSSVYLLQKYTNADEQLKREKRWKDRRRKNTGSFQCI